MCFKEYGVNYFRNYKFEKTPWILNENKNLLIKKSSIINAGNGLYSKIKIQSGTKILSYQGEPLERWQYEALEKSDIYTGVKLSLPKIGICIWRGVATTMGTYINSTMKEKDANVEFIIDTTQIDYKKKIIKAGLVNIFVKPDCEIKPGQELFLFYGSDFWKYFKNRNEPYCILCISFDSHKKNLMLLCDNCGHGFHEKCLLKHNHKKEKIPKEDWFCFNCK